MKKISFLLFVAILCGFNVKSGAATTDAWQQRAANVPAARSAHTAVWTGSEMIVWGGGGSGSPFNDGGRYDPVANSWTAVSTTGAPAGRYSHTAVWTGGEMIVWGGFGGGDLNDGGRYNPVANSWTAVTTTGAPAARDSHTAVWTGSEMIVWGGIGSSGYLNDGGRYNPAGNSWTAVTATGAPVARYVHTAVWTGSEMIIWGGFYFDGSSHYLNDGGRYNPVGDSWTPVGTNGAPAARGYQTAVWTGSEIIVWGGFNDSGFLNDGGRYNPAGNSWTPVSTNSAPAKRYFQTAVWTGSEMIVWGGFYFDGSSHYLNDGGRYNPAGNSWTAVSTNGAPAARQVHTAVWTGSEMIVWGGTPDASSFLNDGGRYDPAADSWTGAGNAPSPRFGHTAVWTGSELIVWGGFGGGHLNDGGRYNPAANSWTALSTTAAPSGRSFHTAVWTGSEMIVWGGVGGANDVSLRTGGRYNPAGNSWTALRTIGAPSVRRSHTAVWTGTDMIVWGGEDNGIFLNDGSRFDPVADRWSGLPTFNTPHARRGHTAVWTGSEMIVWGGFYSEYVTDLSQYPFPFYREFSLNDGRRYDPQQETWTAISLTGVPVARRDHTAVWTGSEMVVWGGSFSTPTPGQPGETTREVLRDGGRYNPVGNSWTPINNVGTPAPRFDHTAVWTGSEMIVWGGHDSFNFGATGLNDGARYFPAGNSWTAVTTNGAPAARGYQTAVWTGSEMIVFGGSRGTNYFNDTFSYTTNSGVFRITKVVRNGGNLTLSFPTLAGNTYTLWRSDTLAAGSWTDAGLPALPGTGDIGTFTVSATTPPSRFFRVQVGP